MGNCLVQKLKGSVDNPSLIGIGSIKFNIDTSVYDTENSKLFYIIEENNGSNKYPTEKVLEGTVRFQYGNGTDAGTESHADKDIWFAIGVGSVEVANKYNIKRMTLNAGATMDDDVFKTISYMDILNHLEYKDNTKIQADVSKLKTRPQLTSLSLQKSSIGNPNITEFAQKLPNISTLDLYETGVRGTLEEFVEEQLLVRSSGTLSINLISTSVRFNDMDILSILTVEYSSNNAVVKNGESTIGTYNGSTWTYV